jgi:hypothetical protein
VHPPLLSKSTLHVGEGVDDLFFRSVDILRMSKMKEVTFYLPGSVLGFCSIKVGRRGSMGNW